MSPVAGVTLTQYNKIRWMYAQKSDGKCMHSDTAIADKAIGYTGGDAIPKVRRVIAHIEGTPPPRADDTAE